ncbi:unnamed protein product [Closterium sp. Yama58-4]|nr:unnamed protein product [Closterium sp. Yama58-4]
MDDVERRGLLKLDILVQHAPGNPSALVSQYAMDDVERLGLLKFDILGLRNLTTAHLARLLAQRTYGVTLPVIEKLPVENRATFELLSGGDVDGVFQLEASPGMKKVVRALKPSCLADIFAIVALYRPGPLDAGLVDRYINRKHGREPVSFQTPKLEPILKETYGVLLYQEQIMRMARDLAGYSLGQADMLRRAMGKKKQEEMVAHHERFVEGAVERGVERAVAEDLFEQMVKFSQYCFNKSHSAAYGYLTYVTAFLKANYPLPYMAALLSTSMLEPPTLRRYVNSCRAARINILPPSVNASAYDFSVELLKTGMEGEEERAEGFGQVSPSGPATSAADGGIQFGLAGIRDVSRAAAEEIIGKREAGGRFVSIQDLVDRIDLGMWKRPTIHALAHSGALDCLILGEGEGGGGGDMGGEGGGGGDRGGEGGGGGDRGGEGGRVGSEGVMVEAGEGDGVRGGVGEAEGVEGGERVGNEGGERGGDGGEEVYVDRKGLAELLEGLVKGRKERIKAEIKAVARRERELAMQQRREEKQREKAAKELQRQQERQAREEKKERERVERERKREQQRIEREQKKMLQGKGRGSKQEAAVVLANTAAADNSVTPADSVMAEAAAGVDPSSASNGAVITTSPPPTTAPSLTSTTTTTIPAFITPPPPPIPQSVTAALILRRPLQEEEMVERLAQEKALLGFYVTQHPVEALLPSLPEWLSLTPLASCAHVGLTKALEDSAAAAAAAARGGGRRRRGGGSGKGGKDGPLVAVVAMVEAVNVRMTKNSNKQMANLQLDDGTGQLEAVVFPDVFARYGSSLSKGATVLAWCTVDVELDDSPAAAGSGDSSSSSSSSKEEGSADVAARQESLSFSAAAGAESDTEGQDDTSAGHTLPLAPPAINRLQLVVQAAVPTSTAQFVRVDLTAQEGKDPQHLHALRSTIQQVRRDADNRHEARVMQQDVQRDVEPQVQHWVRQQRVSAAGAVPVVVRVWPDTHAMPREIVAKKGSTPYGEWAGAGWGGSGWGGEAFYVEDAERAAEELGYAGYRARVVPILSHKCEEKRKEEGLWGTIIKLRIGILQSAKMRKRDLGILLISAFAVFICLQHESNFTFREAWFHVHRDDYNQELESHVVPPPVVFDLNGDGRKEVILATRDARLQVIEPFTPPSGESYHPVRVLKEVSLQPGQVELNPAGHQAVAFAVGYLDPPSVKPPKKLGSGKAVSVPRRKAVVAVVTAGWAVLCFDHNLKLLWETSVQHHFPHGARHKEVAVLIANHTMHRGDRGVVIVGGSMESDPLQFEDPVEEEEAEEEGEEKHRKEAGDKDELEDVSEGAAGVNERHFSYYAFDGATGAMRWKHDSKDFHRDMSALSQQLLPQHNYKLDASSLSSRHFGEMECREFRESILKHLPHRWDHRHDTRFELASIHRHRRRMHKRLPGSGRHGAPHHAAHPHGTPPRLLAGRDHERNVFARAVGKAVDAAGSTKKAKHAQHHAHGNASAHHWWAHNAVIAHLEEGIEVIHLYSGRTICKLLLPDHGLHADVNGDGVLDHVQASGALGDELFTFGSEEEASEVVKSCWTMALSGIPPTQPLFNGSICRPHASLFNLASEFQEQWNEHATGQQRVGVVAPILLPRRDRHHRHQRRHGDVIYFNSRGEITSYATEPLSSKGPHGHMRWQISTDAKWTPADPAAAFDSSAPPAHVPSLRAMALKAGGRPEVILAVGDNEAVFVSPGGKILGTLALPTTPTEPIIVADFNGDRLNDLIIVTAIGPYGFVQVRQPGAMLLSSLLGCLVIVMSVIFVSLHLDAPRGGKPRGRSTD